MTVKGVFLVIGVSSTHSFLLCESTPGVSEVLARRAACGEMNIQ